MISRVLVSVLVLCGLMVASPAHADTGERDHRFISRDICVERGPAVKGWHLREAAEAWTATGLVTVTLRTSCDGAASTIKVRQRWALPLGASGRTSWPALRYGRDGHWSDAGHAQWLYPEAQIDLNGTNLRWIKREDRRCYGWHVAAHEIGHALGLWHAPGFWRLMAEEAEWRGARCMLIPQADVDALADLGYPAS